MIIGIVGALHAGKDSVAAVLVEEYGFTRLAFGDGVKAELASRLRRTLLAVLMGSSTLWSRYVGWLQKTNQDVSDDTKIHFLLYVEKPPIVRALMQEYGTEVRREDDWDYWVKRLDVTWSAMGCPSLVIPDVRFENEANFIRRWKGPLWLVARPGHETGPTKHASERGLPDHLPFDALIHNNATLAALRLSVRQAATRAGLVGKGA